MIIWWSVVIMQVIFYHAVAPRQVSIGWHTWNNCRKCKWILTLVISPWEWHRRSVMGECELWGSMSHHEGSHRSQLGHGRDAWIATMVCPPVRHSQGLGLNHHECIQYEQGQKRRWDGCSLGAVWGLWKLHQPLPFWDHVGYQLPALHPTGELAKLGVSQSACNLR